MLDDWFAAKVISNTLLGEGFAVGSECVYRKMSDTSPKKFEVFNISNVLKELTGEECNSQLRALRDSKNNVVRASDQGYIIWKYEEVKKSKQWETDDE